MGRVRPNKTAGGSPVALAWRTLSLYDVCWVEVLCAPDRQQRAATTASGFTGPDAVCQSSATDSDERAGAYYRWTRTNSGPQAIQVARTRMLDGQSLIMVKGSLRGLEPHRLPFSCNRPYGPGPHARLRPWKQEIPCIFTEYCCYPLASASMPWLDLFQHC